MEASCDCTETCLLWNRPAAPRTTQEDLFSHNSTLIPSGGIQRIVRVRNVTVDRLWHVFTLVGDKTRRFLSTPQNKIRIHSRVKVAWGQPTARYRTHVFVNEKA